MTLMAWDIKKVCVNIPDIGSFIQMLREIAAAYGTHIICFNAEMVAGKAHVEAALMHGIRAEQEGIQISNSLEMEALLFAAGSRQCSEAMKFGIHEGENRMYLCMCPPSDTAWSVLHPMLSETDEDWEEISLEKQQLLMDLFDITPEEIEVAGMERLRALVLERVALLEVYR